MPSFCPWYGKTVTSIGSGVIERTMPADRLSGSFDSNPALRQKPTREGPGTRQTAKMWEDIALPQANEFN
jgi:hypothetical protein